MIHMLSRFEVTHGVAPTAFAKAYSRLAEAMIDQGLLISATPVGQRLLDTPMDTDADDAATFYSTMTFRDRAQLDGAYAYLLTPPETGKDREAHDFVKSSSRAQVFTCWEDFADEG